MNWLKNHKILLVLILLFSFGTRIWQLEHPNSFYFDEVYHAYTAQNYAQNNSQGYEWWNTAPEVVPYCKDLNCAAIDWLHPPLAKLIQAGSIKLIGDIPFAWRYPGVLFNTATVFVLYLFGLRLFKSSLLGIFAAIIFSVDGLSLTSSRITMNDTYLAFWATVALYVYFRKKPLWVIGIILGAAIATKWQGIFIIGVIGLIWLIGMIRSKKLFQNVGRGFLYFLIIPGTIYLFSYTQFWLQGHTVSQFVELHQQIWWYQTNLRADHPYASVPFEWVMMSKPLFAYTSDVIDGTVGKIYLMGNPFIFWGGIISVVYGFYYLIRSKFNKSYKSSLYLLGVISLYLGIFVPWVASPRIMFIYHYVPALPFLSLIIAWVLNKLWIKQKLFVVSYLVLVICSFIYFYPHWTGIAVPVWWDEQYYWFSSWR